MAANAVADATRARVQHGPDTIALIEADLDEVVAAAERAQMAQALGLAKGGMLVFELSQPCIEPAVAKKPSHRGGHGIFPAALAPNATVRHRGLDAKPQALEIVGQFRRCQR